MSTTRDRIIDEAMHLFSQHGFAATSVAKIEAAAGLSPGAGGLYHHFASKEAVLAAGIERQLSRLDALRDIRALLTPLGDLRVELTLIARYILVELDNESELLRILATEARSRPKLLTTAIDRLVTSTFKGFAGWIDERAGNPLSEVEAATIASLGLGALICNRVLSDVFGVPDAVDDVALVDTWVLMMMRVLEGESAPAA